MIRIGVISDTHIPKQAKSLPDSVADVLSKLDFIIHAGDFETMEAYRQIQKINKVIAVRGNMDDHSIKNTLPDREIINVDHIPIGIAHGWGDPHTLPDRMLKEFANADVKCVIFGHSHQAMNEVRNGILLFNPGSPTDIFYAHYRSYGVIEVAGDEIKGELVIVEDSL